MATSAERKRTETQDAEREGEFDLPVQRRLAHLLRALAIAAPILLFLGATLVGIGFWLTMQPTLGSLALWLALAGGVLAILVAMFLPGS